MDVACFFITRVASYICTNGLFMRRDVLNYFLQDFDNMVHVAEGVVSYPKPIGTATGHSCGW